MTVVATGNMRLRGLIAGVGLVLALAIVIVAVLIVRGDGTSAPPTSTSSAPSTVVTSPYDFSEADTPVDFQKFAEAKFFSLTLETPAGLKSYLLGRTSAGFGTLAAALATAQEVAGPGSVTSGGPATTGGPAATGGPVTADGSAASAGPPSSTTPDEIRPSLTVVMTDRTTFTFALDFADGLLVRNGRAWKLEGDLETLLESVSE